MSPPQLTLRNASDTEGPSGDLIRQWLREHNWSANPEFMRRLQEMNFEAAPLVIYAETNGEVIGGLFAETQLAWLRISIMSVHPEHRSRGIGAALMAEAERQATERGCRHAYVDTMSYQAPRFYQAHGYRIAGEIADWDSHGHAKYYLVKELK